MKLLNIVKETKKFHAFMFIQNTIKKISKMHFADEKVTPNDLIAFYVKEAMNVRFEDEDMDLYDAYIGVATLLAFINRMTTPYDTPLSMDEVFEIKNLTDNDILAECVGLMVKAAFENKPEELDEYSNCLMDLIEDYLPSDDPDDQSDTPDHEPEENKETIQS